MSEALLTLDGVDARYGGVQALRGVSLEVRPGEVVAVLGANGAGKTTTLRAISGTVRARGSVVLAGRGLRRRTPERMARLGVAHVPEGRGLVPSLTVDEHLRLGSILRRERGAVRTDVERVRGIFPWLGERGDQRAGTLSGGEQQMLAIARALLARPRLLLLDEPSLGLAPLVVREIFRIVGEVSAGEGLAVLVVEQNAALALQAASRAYVLETGQVALEGSGEELLSDEGVRAAYLGY